jgi:hypothetical protein
MMINFNILVLFSLILFVNLKPNHASGLNKCNENNRFKINSNKEGLNVSSKNDNTKTPIVSWTRNYTTSLAPLKTISIKSQEVKLENHQLENSDLTLTFNNNHDSTWMLLTKSFQSKANNVLLSQEDKLNVLKVFKNLGDEEKTDINDLYTFEEENVIYCFYIMSEKKYYWIFFWFKDCHFYRHQKQPNLHNIERLLSDEANRH